ncbi:hypothetical protein HHK36_021773 [Tetracentron sinense]|uniref:Uncharacterized protein n=1 Tax=Tetracentron sinense TaxID=13715 RepID=A0A835DAY6_TETSI|nr:hypothetical protein HHK36_021773 [Tetracentron sinense]
MPGTIQVSVLDLMGFPTSSSSSSISIKVSMGKREYQTWDKGDFSFPLMSLRDNLIVTLQDADGNELSRTGVETLSVVEKGFWDDLFPLEGGGHLHMKLQFTLSDEERQRIQIMRESALKKKQGELPSSSLRHSESAPTFDDNVSTSLSLNHAISGSVPAYLYKTIKLYLDVTTPAFSQDSQESLLQIEAVNAAEVSIQGGSISNPVSCGEDAQSGLENREGTPLDYGSEGTSSMGQQSQEVEILHLTEVNHDEFVEKIETQSPPTDVAVRAISLQEALDYQLGFSKSFVAENKKSNSNPLEEDRAPSPEKQSSLDKTPSNVRKMISDFELAQGLRPRLNLPTTTSESGKIGIEGSSKGPSLKEASTEKTKPTQQISGRGENYFLTGRLWESQQTPTYIRKNGDRIGFDRASDRMLSSQSTRNLEECGAKLTQPKEANPIVENKFKLVHKEEIKNEEKTSPEDLVRLSTAEAATASTRMPDGHAGTDQLCSSFTHQQDSVGILILEESGSRTCAKDSHKINIREATNENQKFVAYSEDEHCPFEILGSGIFPDGTRHLCITTGGKQARDLVGGCGIYAESHQRKMSLSGPEAVKEHNIHGDTDIEVNKDEKTSHNLRKLELENSAGVKTSGLTGQVCLVSGVDLIFGSTCPDVESLDEYVSNSFEIKGMTIDTT